MKLAGIFQDLEHLYDFQTMSYGGHFVFQNEAKIFQRQVFIPINIPCKFDEASWNISRFRAPLQFSNNYYYFFFFFNMFISQEYRDTLFTKKHNTRDNKTYQNT